MKAINYIYNIAYKVSNSDKKMVVLTQKPYFRGLETVLEIPLEDVDTVLESLKKAKEELSRIELNEIRVENKVILEPLTINTLVALFLSGVSITALAKQYAIDEDIIKENLEEKGIIILEDF